MKSREFIREHVIPAGGVLEKKVGDHHVYRLPSGRKIEIPVGGSQSEVSKFLERRLRKYLADDKPQERREQQKESA